MNNLSKLILILMSFVFFSKAYPAVYYVDYDNGNNKNNGISIESPLKNYPGDPNTTKNHSNIKLKPGDKVIFKGGVKYKGTVYIKISGTSFSPIVFDGNSKGDFGKGNAIIDGSNMILDVYKCKHPVRNEIIACTKKIKKNAGLNIFWGNKRLNESNSLNISDVYLQDYLKDFKSINYKPEADNYLKLTDEKFEEILSSWKNASLVIWGNGNQIYRRNIIRIDKLDKKIFFEPVNFNKKSKYIIVNTAMSLDRRGEYYFDKNNNVLYMMPYSDNFSELSYAVRHVGIDIFANNIAVKGFIIEKFGSSDLGRTGIGVKIYGKNKLTPLQNVVIDQNIIRNHNAIDKSGVVTILYGDNIQIINNKIMKSSPNRGVLAMNSNNIITKNNLIEDITGTGIAYFRVNNSAIEDNEIYNIRGVHANGISIYLGSNNNYVFDNCIAKGLSAFTTNEASKTLVAANIFHSEKDNYTVADWGGSNDLQFYNNLVINPYSKSLYISKKSTGIKVVNSILDGLLIDDKEALISHNVYTKLSWKQNRRYKWKPGEGDILKYVGSTSNKINHLFENKGLKIKLPFHAGVELRSIGYPYKLKSSCKFAIRRFD